MGKRIRFYPELKIRNLDALPRGTGCPFLLCIQGPHDELVAKQWKRKEPSTLGPIETLIVFDHVTTTQHRLEW